MTTWLVVADALWRVPLVAHRGIFGAPQNLVAIRGEADIE
jgi:hypothetical protein